MLVVLWFCLLTKLNSDLIEIVMVSLYKHNCHDLLRLDIQYNKQTIYRWKGETTEPTWELRLDMCWLKPFFLTNSQCIMADIIKKSPEVGISHNFFFNFTAVPQVFSDGFKSKKVQNMCFLHSLNAVCVSFSCVFCPSSCWNILHKTTAGPREEL